MKFEDYKKIIKTFAVYPRDNELAAISYRALGLNGEAGEIADQVKKAIRNDCAISAECRAKILEEHGDCLWYITRLDIKFEMPLEARDQANVEKLEKRRESGGLKYERPKI